jgi:hypothetical protein
MGAVRIYLLPNGDIGQAFASDRLYPFFDWYGVRCDPLEDELTIVSRYREQGTPVLRDEANRHFVVGMLYEYLGSYLQRDYATQEVEQPLRHLVDAPDVRQFRAASRQIVALGADVAKLWSLLFSRPFWGGVVLPRTGYWTTSESAAMRAGLAGPLAEKPTRPSLPDWKAGPDEAIRALYDALCSAEAGGDGLLFRH